MNDIILNEADVDKISRFHSLQTGQYWRALQEIASEGIDEGTVLLIQSIRWVDDVPHTIILRPHPSKFGQTVYLKLKTEDGNDKQVYFKYDEHRFLLNDFLARFEYEPDHQKIRREEVQRIQGKIADLQGELIEAQSNPNLLANVVQDELRKQEPEKKATSESNNETPEGTGSEADRTHLPALPGQSLASLATGTISNAISAGITETSIAAIRQAANREHQIATIKSKWIQGKTSEIAATIKAMTPFYEEQAAAALAQTEDVRTYVAKLMQGIESLDLYVGKDVEVETIREGAPAPKDVPLTFVQKKLLMDEELAVWADIDEWFDFAKENLFFDALRKHDGLIDQIFPTERCVLVMAVTRREIDYGEAWTNMRRNKENKKVFLLVRNGMNVHRVFSPVESHLGTARLFPSKNDHERIFRGYDGSQIKFEDISYTDKLAAHESYALHYKRFLLLACGLDHRLKLFGDFYEGPQSFQFVSMEFQEKYCHFLHDDDGEGMLPSAEQPQSLSDWIAEKNGYLRSGSRVLCNWRSAMNPHTAPGACKKRGDSFDRDYDPTNQLDVVIAFREGSSVCTEIEVGRKWRGDRRFNCKVNLSKYQASYWDSTELSFLCLDAVCPEELHWYIHNRRTRGDHIFYIRFFKTALKFIQQERLDEQSTRQRLTQALAEGRIAVGDEAAKIIDQAVIAWRAANRGKPLPAFNVDGTAPAAWKSLLDQMYMLAGEGQRQTSEVESFLGDKGYQPLRLVLSGGAKLVVYAAPRDDERDDRLVRHTWVHRITLDRNKTKLVEKARRWALLPKAVASETTIHQWEGAEDWVFGDSVFRTYERKQEICAIASKYSSLLMPFSGSKMEKEDFSIQRYDWSSLREEMLLGATHVVNPVMAVPFGLVLFPRSNEMRFLCVGSTVPHGLLYRHAPDEKAQQDIRNEFTKSYSRKDFAHKTFESAINNEAPWGLMEITVSLGQSKIDAYVHSSHDVSWSWLDGKHPSDPLLANWFEKWRAEWEKKHAVIWIADGALDEDNRLSFDKILGIKRPDDYDPKKVHEINLRGDDAPEFNHWFDICSEELESKSLLPNGAKSWSGSYANCISPAAARRYIESQAKSYEQASIAVPATSLAGVFMPPDGVERWYVIPAQSQE